MGKDLFTSMSISASGMSAQRKRMEAISQNIANAETTRAEDGEAYKRKRVSFSTDSTEVQKLSGPRHSMSLTQTAPAHLSGGNLSAKSAPYQIEPATEGGEAAEVDLDMEMVAVAENQLRFSLAARLSALQIAGLRASIQGRR